MAFDIEISTLALAELKAIRVFDRRRIIEATKQQLSREPMVVTRNRKQLVGVSPDFDHVPPIWELRVGQYRVFYDVDEAEQKVYLRAVRLKEPGQTTEEVIHERDNN